MSENKEPMPFQYKVLCIWPFISLFTYAVTGNINGYDAWGIEFVSIFVGFCLSIVVGISIEVAGMYIEDD